MKRISRPISLAAVLLVLSFVGRAAETSDVEDLTAMLNEFLANAGVDSRVVGPIVDVDQFRPRRRQTGVAPERSVRMVAMIRPSTPRR